MNSCYIYGPPGSGKTHFIYSLQESKDFILISASFRSMVSLLDEISTEVMRANFMKETLMFKEEPKALKKGIIIDGFRDSPELHETGFWVSVHTLVLAGFPVVLVSQDPPPKDIHPNFSLIKISRSLYPF